MFHSLFNPDSYLYAIVSAQVSTRLLLFAYAGTSIVATAFGIFLWRRARTISSFYLLLLSLCFGIYCFLDLLTWTSTPRVSLFAWSLLDIFWMCLLVLSYWFLYTFIKNRDLPQWQKIAGLCILIPNIVMPLTDIRLNTFFTSDYSANESDVVLNYEYLVGLFFILVVCSFTFMEHRRVADNPERKRIFLAGIGVLSFLFMLNFWGFFSLLVGRFNFWGYGENAYYYIFEIYGLFGMPILLAFLGYLVMQYQAFGIKPVRSVALVIVLMLLLFVSVFI